MTEKEDNLYGALSRFIDKLEAISEEQEWPELMEMVMGQVFEKPAEDNAEKVLSQEQFLMRLCLRYETFKKSDFNIVSMFDRYGIKGFRIANYDYKTFLWAKKVYDQEIDNNSIYMPYTKLSKKQIETLEQKAVNNYNVGEK